MPSVLSRPVMVRMSLLPTQESIAHAKAAMLAERAEVERRTGVRIQEDGRIAKHITIPCGQCARSFLGKSEGEALMRWASHRIRVHQST